MKRFNCFSVTAFMCVLLFLAGCADRSKIDEIERTQKEIIAKLDAVAQNQEKILKFFQPRQPADDTKVHNIPVGSSPVKGDRNAPVNIVEFSDFQCPYCAQLQPTLKEILKAYPGKVNLVFKHFPLSFHAQARNAVKASLAAAEQGKFWEMHDLIFENYKSLTEERFREFAEKLGLDTGKFTSDYSSTRFEKQIQDDMSVAQTVGVRGTPTLFINGRKMTGRSIDDFKGMIEEAIKKKG